MANGKLKMVGDSIVKPLVLLALLLPTMVYADTAIELLDAFKDLFGKVISVLIGVAVVVFFWGLVKFIAHAGDEKSHDEGKQLLIYGLVGIFVMVALWAILGFVSTELGLSEAPALGALPQQQSTLP